MKIGDLVILVKYAQGAVIFDSFFGYLKFLKPSQRIIFLSQIVELIGHFAIEDSVAGRAIQESELVNTSSGCLILKEGVNEIQLRKIVALPETELESSFKLLLTVFSIGYQDGFQKNKNASDKFWYWDYSQIENTFKFLELDDKQHVQLDEVLLP